MASKTLPFYVFSHKFLCTTSMMITLVSNHMFLGPRNSIKPSMRLPWVCYFKEIQHGVQYCLHYRLLAITFSLFGLV